MIVKRWCDTKKRFLYSVRLRDADGKRRMFGSAHTSIKLVREFEEKKKREIAEKKMFPERFVQRIQLKDFIPEYLEKHASRKRSYRDYLSICKKLSAFFGEYYLDQITKYHVETYQSMRFEKVGVYMLNREITILKGIFTKAIDWGFVFKNPVKGVKLEKEKPRFRFLNEQERNKLVDACNKGSQGSLFGFNGQG